MIIDSRYLLILMCFKEILQNLPYSWNLLLNCQECTMTELVMTLKKIFKKIYTTIHSGGKITLENTNWTFCLVNVLYIKTKE